MIEDRTKSMHARTPSIARAPWTPVPVYGARKDKVNIERGGRGYCIVIQFKLGQVIGHAYKYLECNGCPRRGRSAPGFHAFSYKRNLP